MGKEDSSYCNVASLHPAEWLMSHVVEGSWYTVGFSPTWPLTSLTNLTITQQLSPHLGKSCHCHIISGKAFKSTGNLGDLETL